MGTERGILIRLDREIREYGDDIETLKNFGAPPYLIATFSQIKENKIRRKNELLKTL